MCDKAVKEGSSSLEYVPDWFVRTEWMCMWYDHYYDDDRNHWDNEFVRHLNMMQKQQKLQTS